jgi:hypothetical protein
MKTNIIKYHIKVIYLKMQEKVERLQKEITRMEHFKEHNIKVKRKEMYQLERDILKTSRQLGGI